MTSTKRRVLFDLKKFLEEYLAGKDFFACVYGSYLKRHRFFHSDVDIFIATDRYSREDISRVKDFIVGLHVSNQLSLDEEVPYENKLFVSYNELEMAVSLCGLSVADGSFLVPQVIKKKSFLASLQVKFRLAFNALTSPHKVLGNKTVCQQFKSIAERNILLLSMDLLKKEKLTRDEILEALLKGSNGEEGEMFLGYKRQSYVVNYLRRLLSEQLQYFRIMGEVELNAEFVYILSNKSICALHENYRRLKHEKQPLFV